MTVLDKLREMGFPTFYPNYPGADGEPGFGYLRAIMRREIPPMVRNGYVQEGWFEDAACTRPVVPSFASSGTYYAGWRPWTSAEAEKMAHYNAELTAAKYAIARPNAYEWESFIPYFETANELIFGYEVNKLPWDDKADMLFNALVEAKSQLKQLCDPEETIWYIWEDQMPQASDAEMYDYFYCFDYPGFKPFLVPYLLPDQSKVKGNVIVIAGGGFEQRCNHTEGYPVAKAFNRCGYNAYVLQRRLTPSADVDAMLDLQRSIRYLKYHAEKLGIGAIGHIATCGFSGGGLTILGALERCYGDKKPNEIYPDYIPDAIDAVNADYEVAMPIYGGYGPQTLENPNLPSLFVVMCARDQLIQGPRPETGVYNERAFNECWFFDLQRSNPGIDMELHMFAGVGHGFSINDGTLFTEGRAASPVDQIITAGTDYWMHLADEFMQVRFGYVPRRKLHE